MNTIPQYCQNCRQQNVLGESKCRRCGARLMLVVFPQSLKYDTNYVPTYYEDHLLERVTALELRLAQITERLSTTLDLMLRQTKTSRADHLLLETLIESLNTLGAVEKDKLTQNWRERLELSEKNESGKNRHEKVLAKILARHGAAEKADIFAHLVREGIKFLAENQEKQALRTLERAVVLSPKNAPLFLFIGETLFRADKFELAKNYLESAQTHAARDTKILLLLGVIYADEGNAGEAEKCLSFISEKKQPAFIVNYVSGMLAAFAGDWARTLKFFKETLAAENLPETNYLTACAHFQLGHYKMAQRHLQKAVESDANFADAWYMLSVLYEASGDAGKSREAAELAWSSRETGAQCLEFLKEKKKENLSTALPFLRLRHLKNRLLTSGSRRLTKLFREEIFRALE